MRSWRSGIGAVIGLDHAYIKLGMDGNEAMIEDDIGNTLRLDI